MQRVLLDTHAFVWWSEDRDLLSAEARQTISDPEISVLVSAASAWELAIKARLGKFKSAQFVAAFPSELQRQHFEELRISVEHALKAGGLQIPHKDPFDRMLAAQAQVENVAVISKDKVFDRCLVSRIW